MKTNFLTTAMALLAGCSLAASEIHAPLTAFRDVTMAAWAPTTTISSVVATNGGAYAATGTWYYAVAPTNNLGAAAISAITNVTVATGQLVRIRWGLVGGATGYRVYRGPQVTNLSEYVTPGVVTQYLDYGTNTWTAGVPATTATNVPTLVLARAGSAPLEAITKAQLDAVVSPTGWVQAIVSADGSVAITPGVTNNMSVTGYVAGAVAPVAASVSGILSSNFQNGAQVGTNITGRFATATNSDFPLITWGATQAISTVGGSVVTSSYDAATRRLSWSNSAAAGGGSGTFTQAIIGASNFTTAINLQIDSSSTLAPSWVPGTGGVILLTMPTPAQAGIIIYPLPTFYPLATAAFDSYPATTNDAIGWYWQRVGQLASVSTFTASNYLHAAGWSVSVSGTVQTGRAQWSTLVPYGLTNINTISSAWYDNQATTTPPVFTFSQQRLDATTNWVVVAYSAPLTGAVSAASTWSRNSFTLGWPCQYGDTIQIMAVASFACTNSANPRYQLIDASRGWEAK